MNWRSRLYKLRGHRRLWIFVGVPLAIILVIAYAIAFLIDEPLRRYTEAKMNRALKGYTVHIKELNFHPHGFSLDLKGVTFWQALDALAKEADAQVSLYQRDGVLHALR